MKTGVIGLGAMGANMAENFYKAGHLHTVWNRTESKAKAFVADKNINLAGSVSTLAAECELIVISVSEDKDVIEVIHLIAQGAKPGSIVVDTSTVRKSTAIEAADLLTEKGVAFLDCPVSGGVEGAQKGTLAMMVGGDEAVLGKVHSTLSAIAKDIVYIGPTGSGQACKALNQIMCAGINQAVTEALAFGEAMELDMDKVIGVVAKGAAGNWFLDHRGKTMLAGDYVRGFKVSLHHKDLENCMAMIKAIKLSGLPLTEMTIHHYQQLMKQGHSDEDISSLYRLKRSQ